MIPNGLDIKRYPFIYRDSIKPNLFWLRAFHHTYNPALAVQVVAKLKVDFPGVNLIMTGPDKGDGSLQQTMTLAGSLKVNDSINFAGKVEKSSVPGYLNRGDIFINTTNFDNTPISVIEAMACGLCIISTNVGGLPYLLEDGVDALLVPPNDSEAMAAAIRRVLTERGLAEKLSSTARKKAEQFDWSVVLPLLERLFEEIIEKSHNE